MLELVLLATLASTELTIQVDRPLPATLRCVEAVLIDQGESIIRIDEAQGLMLSGMRLISLETLHQIAATNRMKATIRWTKGIYQLSIALSHNEQGGTLVRTTARILGYGESDLRSMRPSPWWPLPSTGHLEAGILAAVTASCQTHP